jgi:hypothetical protein
MFYFDPMYLVFAAPALLLAMFAQWKVSSAYAKYTKVRNAKNISGIEVAQYLMRANGLNLNVNGTPGQLTDHYDPRDKTLYLSEGVARTPSVAALAIVASLLGLAILLVPLKGVTVKMLPFDNKSELQVIIDMPENVTLEETAALLVGHDVIPIAVQHEQGHPDLLHLAQRVVLGS